ncbi:MAG: peptide chain release factor N(5)-glutamine methyltransferase [Bacilli bacterium]|nr:peptide chain release factor N(5)-glutamine methyltransferase [Bacilli bacterium]MDD4547664.1 peptide chain release factor N(5)-glutamine methyltransferase [Bacilli bacterium]
MTDIEYLKKYYQKDNLDDAVKRLKQGEPVQYIVGEVDFYGNKIIVNKNVLIPRFETEELVSKTIVYLKKYFTNPITIVDLGCGSGCIAITIKKQIPKNEVIAVDISSDALEVAKENALINGVEIEFLLGDMLKPINKKVDCIISNPPYIGYDEEVMEIVKDNEPNIALYAPNNGLKHYEIILKNAKSYLNNEYLIAFEIGYKQANDICKIAKRYLKNSIITVEQDLQGKDRYIFITNIKNHIL